MQQSQRALAHWLEGRVDPWKRLDQHLRQQQDNRRQDPADVIELVEGFRALARDLSLARKVMPGGRITRYLEALFARTYEAIYRPPRDILRTLLDLYRWEVPQHLRQMRGSILATVSLFLLFLLGGWLLVHENPELAALFASRVMIDAVEEGKLWTDDLINILPSSVLAFSLMTNNITVALFAFALGAFYGLGTIYIISLNGLMLGGTFAFTGHYGLAGQLFNFVIAHGVVELSVICLAGAAGIQLGEALIRPGPRSRLVAFRETVARAGRLLVASLPFLVVAGLIEGFISPDPNVPLFVRLVIGLGVGTFFWLVLAGKIWRSNE